MNDELLKDIIIFSMLLELVMVGIIASMQIKIYNYKRKIYFIKRDRERCNELLFASKDGYFCFVYPDQKIKDPQKEIMEKCSRRLSVLLGLKNGTASSFAEISEAFLKEDAQNLKKYVDNLKQDGTPFEDMISLKGSSRHICVYGNRINGADSNLYCDIVWFRDVSNEVAKIVQLENEKTSIQNSMLQFENMVDSFNSPMWLRDEKLALLAVNKKYLEYTGKTTKTEVISKKIEICNNKGENVAKNLAVMAQKSKKNQKKSLNIVHNGSLHNFEILESPYFVDNSLDKIGTVGYLSDNTDLEKAKRNFKINQNNHLEILGVLGTAFAIFDNKSKLYFYNNSFKNLWNLESDFLEKTPTYIQFVENIREHKMLPPVPDFKIYKEEEMQVFGGLIDTKEDLLHLPDGRTIRRLRKLHPNGVIFAFEDVSDRLATMRRLNDLTSIQQNILDNLSDSVVIFGANQRLKFYNRAYLKLWSLGIEKVQDEPRMEKIIKYQKLFFSNIDDWENFQQTMLSNIIEGRKFNLIRDDNLKISVSPIIFYDGSIMITYTVK